jgi:hypothetical protein
MGSESERGNTNPDDAAGGKGDPRGSAAGAGMMGGVTGVSGAGRGDERTGGTSGVETEKSTGDDGVASGGSLAGAMNDAGVRATDDPDRGGAGGGPDVMPEIPKSEGGTPNPT